MKPLTRALAETLALLADGHACTTTELFEAGWLGRSALRARLLKLEAAGLVKRTKGSGRRPDSWRITGKGVLVANRKAAA